MTFTIRMRGDSAALIEVEYSCPECGVWEFLARRNALLDVSMCPTCGADSILIISAPMGRVKAGEAIRGSSDERPPHALDTRALAEGMPLHEWRAKQTKIGLEQERKRNRKRIA